MHKIIALLFLALFSIKPAQAATAHSLSPDPAIRSGKLSNGLAYYIARSEEPGEKTSFRLTVRVGSLHSGREPQAAHILEHVIVEKLRDIAAQGTIYERTSRLGAAMNAATGFFATEYFVDMPSGDAAAFAAGIDILVDWATAGELTDEEIDREHKAVVEEMRSGGPSGLTPEQRQQAIWFAGHPFVDATLRRPGIIDASAETIRRLHRDYYKPADMAIVIVGDIDPEATLRALTARLGSLPASSPMPRLKASAPSLRGGHYVPLADQETVVEVSHKIRPAPANSPQRAHDLAVAAIVAKLGPQGFANLGERDGAAISGGFLSISPFYTPLFATDVLTARTYVRSGASREAIVDTLGALAALRRTGFSKAEVKRAKAHLAAQAPLASLVREDAARWTTAFIDGAPPPTAREVSAATAGLTAADVTRTLKKWLDPAHRDIFISYAERDKPGLPAPAEIPALIARANSGPALSFSPPAIVEPVLASGSIEVGPTPPPAQDIRGILRWTLPRSGATLLVRRTDGDQVRLVMRRPGGDARFEDSAAIGARAASDLVGQSGLGGLNQFDLTRFLAARGLAVGTSVWAEREQLSASGPIGSWPQVLALVRARMTDPQCREASFRSYIEQQKGLVELQGAAGDDDAFNRLIETAIGQKWRPDLADLEGFGLETLCGQYRQMFADSAGMTIVVEGKVTPDAVYAGVASVLDIAPASPPAKLQKRPFVETKGGRTLVRRGTSQFARVSLILAVDEDALGGRLTAPALQARMFHRLRSVEEGVYYPRSTIRSGAAGRGTIISVAFDCAPENVDRLIAAAKEEIDRLGKDGLTDAELAAARVATPTGPQKLDAENLAEAWIANRTLSAESVQPSDRDVRDWGAKLFRSARVHEFIRLPETSQAGTAAAPDDLEARLAAQKSPLIGQLFLR
jgi:zinc protease